MLAQASIQRHRNVFKNNKQYPEQMPWRFVIRGFPRVVRIEGSMNLLGTVPIDLPREEVTPPA